jgi:NarL family two-component system response regulator LiaR
MVASGAKKTMEPARPSAKVRVLLVDDHRVVADAIARMLRAEPDIEVVRTASSLADIRHAVGSNPDVALISYLLSDGTGADATRLVKQHRPDVRVIVFSRLTDAYAAARVARAGGDAFLDRHSTSQELISTVRGTPAPADTARRHAGRVVGRRNARRAGAPRPEGLTPRELDVLRALALGRTTSQICSEFGIGHNTVRTHVQNIIAKLRVHSRLEAVALAMREQIV